MKNNTQGSTLMVVLIIGTALTVTGFSALRFVESQQRMNKSSIVYYHARQATEGLIQTAFADLHGRYKKKASFPLDAIAPDKNPLSIRNEWVNFYGNAVSSTDVTIPTKRTYTSVSDFGTEDTEIIGGQITDPKWFVINGALGENERDSNRGSRAMTRWIEVIAKSTATHARLGSRTAYAREVLEIRDTPLASFAIFYNIPMEIAPGAPMNVYGPVHINGDAWFQSGNGLTFHDRVTIAGDLNHGRHPDSGKGDSEGNVSFKNKERNIFVNLKEDTSWDWNTAAKDLFGGGWLESGSDYFQELATNLFNNSLQTTDHGVITANPPGISDYIEDTDPNTPEKESFNSAYNLIQPVLDKDIIDGIADASKKESIESIEKQKISYQAGLIVEVSSGGSLAYKTYNRDASGELVYGGDGLPTYRTLTPPADSNLATYDSFERAPVDADGNAPIVSGLFDKREGQGIDTVELDVGVLATLIHDNDKDDWGGGADDAPEKWWNGAVYVEFPQSEATPTRDDFVNPAVAGKALKLKNGETIPNPSFAHSDDIYGTTIATNQALYVQGNYNADGSDATGSPVAPDYDKDSTPPAGKKKFSEEGGEAPAALLADAITFLSNDWDDVESDQTTNADAGIRKASDTEVSAAILTGLVPSGESGSNSYSGGVENFPRFLEDWGSRTLTIRGSIIALFESEVATGAWGSSDVYSPPNRDWGFHQKFAAGYGPVALPSTRTFRGRDFRTLSASEYAERVTDIKSFLSSL